MMFRKLVSEARTDKGQSLKHFIATLKPKLLSGTGLVMMSRLASMLCIFLLVYVGGEEPTGVYATIASTIGLSSFAIGLGIPANYSYFLGQKLWTDGDIAASRRLSTFCLGSIGCGCWILASELLHEKLFHASVSLTLVRWLGICIPIWIHHNHTLCTLQSYNRLGYYSLINGIAQILPVLFSLALYQLSGNNESVAIGYLVGSALVLLVSLSSLKAVTFSTQILLSAKKTVQATRVGLIGYAGAVASLANYRLDLIFLAIFFGPGVAGNYAVLSRIAEALRILPVAMQISMTPKVAGLSAELAKSEISKALVSIGLFLMMLTPLTYLCGVAGMSMLGIQFTFFGFAIILAGTAFSAYTSAIVGFNVARGKAFLNSVAAIGGLIATLITMPWMVSLWGIVGACVSSGIAYTTMSLLLLWQFSKVRSDSEGSALKPISS